MSPNPTQPTSQSWPSTASRLATPRSSRTKSAARSSTSSRLALPGCTRRRPSRAAAQPGQEQQCAPGPVVGHDVLRLPGGVAGDQHDVAELLAADPSGVVLQEAVLGVRAGEVELLGVIERADVGDD